MTYKQKYDIIDFEFDELPIKDLNKILNVLSKLSDAYIATNDENAVLKNNVIYTLKPTIDISFMNKL